MAKEREGSEVNTKNGSFRDIFMHADCEDMFLMAFGFIGAIGDGLVSPLMIFALSRVMNNIGNASSLAPETFARLMYKNALLMLYVACEGWIASFLEGYCWTRTGERQATRMRARYLKAVLRQDVGYFDLHVTSVSNDILVVQDVFSEKLPDFLMNVTTFFGCYLAGFMMEWRLAIVGFPFVVLLVIPGLMYGRTLMGLARKMREEYNKAGTMPEQAISSIRTVYAFVGEAKTIDEFSSALEGSLKLGLKMGLTKGLAIGSNGVTFAICSFLAYYGSRLVMYHGVQGGIVHAVCACITVGGLSLGTLSNLKYFSEAMSAAEHIMEVIKRVPKIDLENMEDEVLENVSGDVEFRHVEFAYPSRPETIIFKDFCLKVPAGKTVALVGSSGSGKSTVKWLRSQMGLVRQEPALFATTIKANILFGKEDASMEEIIQAAKASNARDFILTEAGSHDKLIQDEDEGGLYTSLLLLQQTEEGNTNPGERVNINRKNENLNSNTSICGVSLASRSSSVESFSQRRASLAGENKKENNNKGDSNKLTVPSFRRLLALNLPEWKQVSLGCLNAILFGAVQPVYAFTWGSMITVYFLADHDEIKAKTRTYSLCFLGLSMFCVLTNVIQHYSFAYTGEYLTKRIRETMLSKILTFEVGWFDQDENSTGAICSRIAKDANVVRSLVGDRMALLVQAFSAVMTAFIMGLVIAWRLALAMKAQDESSKLAAEAVSNLGTIAAFSSQDRILKMLQKAQEATQQESIRQSCFAVRTGRVIGEAGSMTSDLAKGSDAVESVFAVLDR
ncbi:ABC transporter family protein [Melia azedarach]|uniref:ABC transporter family protein n=1 Tax=Melia azedarach TaxID=155640 RepID=A0ACC1X897_MELAZ|nr:ABC transporter family protein [Melia azedarach]